jgi:hypothetical protein
MLQQTATQWDMNAIDRYPPPDERYFILALFVVCIVATVKIGRIWLLAPPFRRTLPTNPQLPKEIAALHQRTHALALASGLFLVFPFFSPALYTFCRI